MKSISLKTAFFGLLVGCLLSFTVLYQLKATTEPNLIIVSKDLVAKKTDLITWEKENSKNYFEDQSNAGFFCKDNVLIDLNGVSTSDGLLVKSWLVKNSDYICFEDSYPYLEEAHLIKDQLFIENINNASNPRVLTYENIKNISNGLIKTAHPTNPTLDFESHGYQAYLNFFTLFGSNPRFVYDFGLTKEGSYSIPFFRSIKHRIEKDFNSVVNEKDIKFTFVKVKNLSNLEVIALVVEASVASSTFKEYYNFSTDPGKPISYKYF